MNDTKLFRLTYDDINDIMNSVHSVHIRDSRSECQVDEEMEKAASASARPEFYGLHRLDSLGRLDRVEFEAESESRKGKTHHAEATTTATGEGALLSVKDVKVMWSQGTESERSIQNFFNQFSKF